MPQQNGFLSNLGGLFGGGLGSAGMTPEEQQQLQRAALFQAGLATLASAQQPGGTLGGSLFSGFQAGAGALQQAQQNAFQSKRIKQQEEREERLLKQENDRIKIAQAEQTRKDREQGSSVARRLSTGLSNAKGRELEYLQLVSPTPEFQSVAQQYGIDPQSITTPEQAQALAQQLGALGGLGADPEKAPPLELKAVLGQDGKPRFVTEAEALGQQPYYQPNVGTTVNLGLPNEGERKDAALAARLELSMNTLKDVESKSPGSGTPSVVEKAAGVFGETARNLVRGEDRQRANAAQLDALDAALTLATGAAYTKDQLENLRNSYFPQIGDDERTRADKAARFETIVNVARLRAGRAAPLIDQAIAGKSAPTAEDFKAATAPRSDYSSLSDDEIRRQLGL